MQLKTLCLFFFLPVCAVSANAQHRDNSMRVVKVDTLKTASTGCAIPLAARNAVVKEERPPMKAVPLAGEKSYFGDMNDYVNQFVRKYLQAHNQTLNIVQDQRSGNFTVMDNILAKNHLPKELKYLAVIESALNHNAVSHAGAVGPWQLMQSTARLMGLTVNRKHDERRDWDKSTYAAAKYLNILYGQLNDWLLVIAAYNSGPTPVLRAIERTGSHNFWDIKKYLPHETQGHVLAFIATASIFENMSKFIGLGNIPLDFNFDANGKATMGNSGSIAKAAFTPEELKSMVIVKLSHPLSMELMAKELNVDQKLLNKWNSDYELFEYNTYPTDYYSLRIPKDKLDNFIKKKSYMEQKSKEIFNEVTM